jgi:hypothetical protein
LPHQILGGDEVHALRAALGFSLPKILVTYQITDHCIPLTALYKLLMMSGLPVTEMAVRLPVVLCGLVALLALPAAFVGRVSRRTVLAYRWLVAISPALVFYGRIARSYMPMVLFAFGAVMAFEAWWRTRSRRAGAAYVALGALALWFHLGAGPIVAAPFLFAAGEVVIRRRSPVRDLRHLFLLGLAIAFTCALFLVPARESLLEVVAAKRAEQTVPWIEVLFGVLRLQAGTASGRLTAIFWGTAVVGLGLLLRSDRRLALFSTVVVAGHVAGLLILSPKGLAGPVILNRYLLPVLPFVLLWVSAAFGPPWKREEPSLLRAMRGAGAVLLVLVLVMAGPFADRAAFRTSFLHHNDFVGFHQPPRRAPAAAVPAFYRELRGETVVELPWVYPWESNRTFYLYQQIHGGRVIVSTPQRILFRPPLALRNAVAPEPEALCGSGARYLIVHRNVAREEDLLAPGGRISDAEIARPLRRLVRAMAANLSARLERRWGKPVYADRWLRVWDLPAVCGGGTHNAAAAASARAARARPIAKLPGR